MAMNLIPPNIQELGRLVRRLQGQAIITAEERQWLNQARLQLAIWACREEKIIITRDNLAAILGPHAREALEFFTGQSNFEAPKQSPEAPAPTAGQMTKPASQQSAQSAR